MADGDEELALPGLGSIRLVRRGDSSSLYRGRQLRFNREVAIKLLPGRVEGERRERFERECAAMGALSAHPHVVTVFDSGIDRKGAYLVSEWLVGGAFAERLARGALLGWRDAVDTGIKLAGALESAHRAGVLHDNLKPQNVLLSSFGDPALGDFALGWPANTRSSDTYDTGAHAAPERFAGQGPSVSSDIYALASVIMTLMLGRPPFATSPDEALLRMAARKEAEPPVDLRLQDVPDGVCLVLESALMATPSGRPPSAARFGRALQATQQAAGAAVTRMVAFPETDEDQPPPAPAPASVRSPVPAATPRGSRGPGPTRSFPDQVRSVLGVAVDRYRGREVGARLAALRSGLRAPVRVLVVGPPGAGKSTLVNGIIGDDVAPTGAGAAPGITRWYSSGPTYAATARLTSGEERPVPISRHDHGVELDLGGLERAGIDHVTVAWPSPSLAALTLIDGPDPDGRLPDADALIYVTPALTQEDLLRIDRAQAGLPPGTASLTTIVVLAPGDHGSAPGSDPLVAAQADVARLRQDPEIGRRAQTVVAVAAVLGAAASTMGPDDLAAVAGDQAGAATGVLARLGPGGGRLAQDVARGDRAATVSQFAHELVGRSGLQELRDVVTGLVVPRCEVVRAGSALDALASALIQEPVAGAERLAFDLEQARASAHPIAELLLLGSIRDGSAGLRGAVATEADHLLGGAHTAPAARLGLTAEARPEQIAGVVAAAIARWRRRAESPVSARREAIAARAVVRSAEGMAQALAPPAG